MSRLRTRIDRLEVTRAPKGPNDWQFEAMLAAIYAVMWERKRTDHTLDPVLLTHVRELLEPDRHLWEQLPIAERKPGRVDKHFPNLLSPD